MFRVGLCVKLLGDSSFQGLFVRQAIWGLYFYSFACASRGLEFRGLGDPLVEETKS